MPGSGICWSKNWAGLLVFLRVVASELYTFLFFSPSPARTSVMAVLFLSASFANFLVSLASFYLRFGALRELLGV